MTSHKIYKPAGDSGSGDSSGAGQTDTHGQCWSGESIEDNLILCEHQTIRPLLLRHLPRQGMILESGCGLGRWVFYLRSLGYDIIGIDLAPEALREAKAFDPEVPIQEGDVLHSDFPDGCFHAAISLGVVEHFEEGPQQALSELRRLLKPGGLLFISVPIQNTVRKLVTNHLKDLNRWRRSRGGERYEFEEYRYERRHFEALLRTAGFEIMDCVADDFSYPKNLGLYADWRVLRSPTQKWELTSSGNRLASLMNSLSPWTICAGAFWVCRRK